MSHNPIVREVPDSTKAVLLIHGIAGSPDHFLPLLSAIPPEYAVYCILLEGHGGTVRDFSKTTMKRWKQQVEFWIELLSRKYQTLIIGGHSMGALFAIQAAKHHPGLFAGLYLLDVPLRIHLKFQAIRNSFRFSLGCIPEYDEPVQAMAKACSIIPTRKLWEYLGWIPRFLELFREICQTRSLAGTISVPSVVIHSGNDELVKLSSAKYFSSTATLITLPDSGHYYYNPSDIEIMRNKLRELCETCSANPTKLID